MTGLECLRAEMEKRGCTKSQIESKSTAVVLDILSQSGTVNADTQEAEKKLAEIKGQIRHEQLVISQLKNQRKLLEDNVRILEEKRLEIRDKDFKEKKDYIENFMQKLSECETPEAKDAMRRAQVFVNSVSVDTKYDNTAFIIGLASILSYGEIGAIEELKKINPKLNTPGISRL